MTKPSYEEPFVTLSYGGTFTAKNVEDALLGAKAELDKAESELARVRGLLQRLYGALHNEEEPNCPLCGKYRSHEADCDWPDVQAVLVRKCAACGHRSNQHKNDGECFAPFPIGSCTCESFQPEGAESADIGKLDSADKSGPSKRIRAKCGTCGGSHDES